MGFILYIIFLIIVLIFAFMIIAGVDDYLIYLEHKYKQKHKDKRRRDGKRRY